MAKVVDKPIKTIQNAFSRFFELESASSIILMISALVAIILANSPLRNLYFDFLDKELCISFGEFSLAKPLILWINDGMMAVFFFVIGLEIKRELIAGELQSFKKSALPITAAIGGMIIPVTLFLLIHPTEQGDRGWGVPMATDIAFSLGILQLLGKRVPISLKIFLTAFAIIDDLGAVLVIAFFYSSTIYWKYLLISLAIYFVLIMVNVFKFELKYLYFFGGVAIWYLMLKSGVHPTLAGIMMAMVTPATRKIGRQAFARNMREVVDDFEKNSSSGQFLNYKQIEAVDKAEKLVTEVQPNLQSLEHKLHMWVAYLIMPVFALANAGVEFNFKEAGGLNPLAFHIGFALFFGKVIGITGFSWLGVKLKFASLPENVNFKHILGISFLGAVGFTMALFINSLAYADPSLANSAKIGIIITSVFSGILGYIYLNKTLKSPL